MTSHEFLLYRGLSDRIVILKCGKPITLSEIMDQYLSSFFNVSVVKLEKELRLDPFELQDMSSQYAESYIEQKFQMFKESFTKDLLDTPLIEEQHVNNGVNDNVYRVRMFIINPKNIIKK